MPFRDNLIRRRVALAVAATGASALALGACGAPGSSSGGSSADANPTSVSTEAPTKAVTLKLYDGQGLKAVDDALIAAFEKANPNITIDPTYDPDDVTSQNQPRQLASADPPDLIRVISITSGTKNNLLTNLDAYSKAYGWDNMSSQLTQFEATDGVAGSGSLYAKPSGFTMTGLYYDKTAAQTVGMTTPPASIDELTALMAKAKTAGLTPMVVGNKEGGGVFPFQLLINSSMGPDKVAAWIFNAPDATIDNDDTVAAAQQILDWQKAGYFPDGVNGIDATGADALFQSGKALFYPWGNWDATTLDKAMPGTVGFMAMPPVTDGGQVGAMSDAATAFGIPAKSENKDAAALFLNFLSSDDARQIALDNGFMPTGPSTAAAPTVDSASVLNDVLAAFQTVTDAGGQVPFVQNATAGISAQGWNPQSQLLYGGKESAQEFVSNIQSEYTSELSQ